MGIKIIRKPIFIVSSTAIIIIVAAAYFYFAEQKIAPFDSIAVRRGEVVKKINVSGSVQPITSTDLAFERTGRVVFVGVQVSDQVKAGQILVQLDNSDLKAQLAKAQADLETQKANLAKSKIDLANLYGDAGNLLTDAYIKANDAVRIQTSALFSNPELNPQLSFSTTDSQAKTDSEYQRQLDSNILNNWKRELANLDASSSSELLEQAVGSAQSNLTAIRNLFSRLSDALNGAILNNSLGFTQSILNVYQSDVNAGLAEINAGLTKINDHRQNIESKKAEIFSEETSLKSYEANIENIQAQLKKTFISAPVDGVITAQNAKIGEVASPGATMVSLISNGQFKIEAYVPEAEIAKIKTGDNAEVMLDAYGNSVVFAAKVGTIDPSETIINSSPTYKVTLFFVGADERIKAGMTADINILAAEKKNTLIIPRRSVITRGQDKFVLVYANGAKLEEREIETGIEGSDGNVEVVSGLKEGERLATFGSR